ncbi:unnamed protein product [Symbiodinium sp. KB8]|nr:unnamed protein product [Symbiodinium sp. KB8]
MSSTGTRLLTCLLALSLAMAAASRAMKVVGVSGSLRAASVNTQLLHIIQKNVAAGNVTGVDFSIADISALPLYNADLESSEVGAPRCEAAAQQRSQLPHRRRAPSQGGVTKFPEAVEAFRAQVKDADAFIFACTEHNYGVSAALKNALDWGSRGGNVWADKAAGMVGAGGRMGTSRAQYHLRTMGVFLNLHFVNKEACFNIWDGTNTVDMADWKVKEDGAWTELLVAHAQAVQQHAQRLVLGKEAEPSTAEVSA